MRVTIWNCFCVSAMLVFAYLLVPCIKAQKISLDEPKDPAAIVQTNSKSLLWKRGKWRSSLTIEEKGSTSNVAGEKKRSSEGWISIKWRKNHDSKR